MNYVLNILKAKIVWYKQLCKLRQLCNKLIWKYTNISKLHTVDTCIREEVNVRSKKLSQVGPKKCKKNQNFGQLDPSPNSKLIEKNHSLTRNSLFELQYSWKFACQKYLYIVLYTT